MNWQKMKAIDPELARLEASAENAGRPVVRRVRMSERKCLGGASRKLGTALCTCRKEPTHGATPRVAGPA